MDGANRGAPEGRRGRGRPSLPVEQQRQRLLDATTRMLGREGFERANVQEIVREAGMSSRSFYECFASKVELIGELVERASALFLSRAARAFDGSPSPPEIVERLLDAYQGLVPVMTLDSELLGGDVRRRFDEIHALYLGRLIDLVLERVRSLLEQGLVSRVPSRVEVELILTGLEGVTRRYHFQGRLVEVVEQRDDLQHLLLALVS